MADYAEILVVIWAMSSGYVSSFEQSTEEQQERINALSDAEAICIALISNLKNHNEREDSMRIYELSCLYEKLARIARAQGRLDEARQLCVEANNHRLVSQDLLLYAHMICSQLRPLCMIA